MSAFRTASARSLTLALVVTVLAIGALGAGALSRAAEPTLDERVTAYREFRANFDAHRYTEALPFATEVLRLTQAQHGREARELVNPLTNVATTYYRLGQYDAALDHYQRALRILEDSAETNDAQLIRPLHGIGASYRALGRDEDAATVLKRALDISRNRNGLFNLQQLDVLRPLVATYMKLDRIEEAGKEQQYAFTVAESAYGKNDVRMLGPLDEYARWNEAAGHYTAARLLHGRAVQIAEQGGRASPLSVDGLRGIARAYRLGYLHGEEDEVDAASSSPLLSDGLQSGVTRMAGPNPDGERALRAAITVLRYEKPPNVARIGAVTVDLGDWYLTAGSAPRAFTSYGEAWKQLSAAGDTTALATPVPLTYKPPAMAVSRRKEDPDDHNRREVRLSLTVNADGQTQDVLSSGDEDAQSAARAVVTAMKRARWRPRFENGEPVVTRDVSFSEPVYVKKR